MKIDFVNYRKLLGYYFLIAGFSTIISIFFNVGLLVILSALLPFRFTFLILIGFIIVGYLNFKESKESYENFLVICMFIMSIQIVFLGITFKNFFGPCLFFGFTDSPELKFYINFKVFDFLFANGYRPESNEISMQANLFPIFLLYIFILLKKRHLKKRSNELSFE
jgi:hypothetical protein